MDRLSLTHDFDISRIVYGMWRLGEGEDASPAAVQAKIETCLESGITTLDQADIYGAYGAEAILGGGLKSAPGLRSQIEIITKCDIVAPFGKYAHKRVKYYDTSREHILASVDTSLQNMGLKYIDVLLIHRPDPLLDHKETGAALDEVIASGKVRYAGVSNFKPHDFTLLQSAMKNPLVTNQIELSVCAIDAFTNGDIAFLQERNVKPMAWSPLGGGRLFNSDLFDTLSPIAERLGTDVANLALAWLIRHPSGIAPVIGTNNLDRIRSAAASAELEIDRETWFEIYTASLGREVP